MSTPARTPRAPTLADALIPLTFLVVSLGAAILIYRDDAILGPVQVALFLSAAVAAQVGYKNGHSVADLSKAAVEEFSKICRILTIFTAEITSLSKYYIRLISRILRQTLPDNSGCPHME